MASTAGRILMLLKGDWNYTTQYYMLDKVNHNNFSWVCKKDCIDIEPSDENVEYWQKDGSVVSMATTEIVGIVKPDGETITIDEDGTLHGASQVPDGVTYIDFDSATETGELIPINADLLDGHGAEYFYQLFAPTTAIPSGADLNTYLTVGTFGIESATIAQSLLNRPSALIRGGKLVVENTHNKNNFYQTIYSSDGVFRRYVSSGTFNNWETIFTTAGGTINGNLYVKKFFEVTVDGADLVTCSVKNGLHNIYLHVSDLGNAGLYDVTFGKWLLKSDPNGITTFNGTASGNLPLNGGGTVSKAGRSPIELKSTNSNNVTTLYSGQDGTLGELGFIGANTPTFRNTSGANNTLLHTGNKPTGTYNGNGDATARQINVGGIGIVIYLRSAAGADFIVGYHGAFGVAIDGTPLHFSDDEIYFRGGVINVSSTNNYLNGSGVVNTYNLL